MNILVFFLSKINPGKNGELPSPKTYISPDRCVFEGIQTNEAAAKYLIAKLFDSGEKLGKIIAVTSREAEENGMQRFIDGIKESCDGKFDISNIKFVQSYLGEQNLDDEAVLANVLSEISPEDTVYLDVSGGRRTDVNMMLLLMKLVKYKGIKIADAFYSDFDGTISSHSGFYRSLDILDGVNQFVTTGNAVQLAECYSSIPEDSPVKALLAAMVDFSDSVNLCSLSGIEDTLFKMKSLIDEIGGSREGGMDMFLFREIIPIIREKFFGNSGSPDYCQIILWCLDNRLIQQAITLYVEKIPKHLFDKGFITAGDWLKSATKEKCQGRGEINLEKEIFFSNLMSCCGLPDDEKAEKNVGKELVDELKVVLANRNYRTGNKAVLAAKRKILSFYHYSKDFDNCDKAVNNILRTKEPDRWLVIIAEELSKKHCDYKAYKIFNDFQNNEPLLRKLLNLPPAITDQSTKTLLTKINTIENALEMNIPEGISVNISRRELQTVMLDYLYARQIRNRINHAADAADNIQKQEEFFSKYRIDFSFSMRSIISQLKKSVEFILNLSKKT